MNSTIVDNTAQTIGKTLLALRKAKGLSLDGLAEKSDVSRAMISKIERGERNPTAQVLGKLAVGLGTSISTLLNPHAGQKSPSAPTVLRAVGQKVWKDPESGYTRRQILPPDVTGTPEAALIELPPRARAEFPAATELTQRHSVWVVEGTLTLTIEETPHRLDEGDSMILGIPPAAIFENRGSSAVRYLVVIGSVLP